MKGKDGVNNVLYAILGQAITLVLGILVPKLFVENLGSETNGLMQTINQVFACFTLIEAGIGVTTVQSLYRPVATDDKYGINAILSATNKYYKKVSVVYLIALLIFASIFGISVRSQFGFYMVFGVVFFTGLNSVINFALQEKYKLLLDASGKKYITTNTQTLITTLSSVAKIVLLLMGFNILGIQISFFIINLLQVLIISLYVKKHYKWIDMSTPPDYTAISQKNSVMVHQFSSLVFANTDVLILTMVCGLSISSVYSMYKLIMSMLSTLFNNVSSGLTFILGQTYSTDKELYKTRINVYDAAYQTFGFSLATVTYIFYMPFMKLYTAGFDQNYLFNNLPLLFIIIELLVVVRNAGLNTINVAGHFRKTQWRSLLETGINLTISSILVFKLGITGVLLGTIIALFYRTNDVIIYSNRKILGRSPWNTYKITLINASLMTVLVFVSRYIPFVTNGYIGLIISAGLTSLVIIPLFYAVVFALCGKERRTIINFVRSYKYDK
ncbi:MAG: sugar isomerase [Clostridiales bacterium]|nr:MAG: sugar isomerase [Clostridiales bacterium]